jgi:hypothetical protein
VRELLNPDGELTCSAQFFDVVAFARGVRCFGGEQRALDERRREVEAGVVARGRPVGGRHRVRPQSAALETPVKPLGRPMLKCTPDAGVCEWVCVGVCERERERAVRRAGDAGEAAGPSHGRRCV